MVVGYPSGAPVNPNPMAENESAEILFYYPEDTPPVEGVLPILTVSRSFWKKIITISDQIAEFCFPLGIEPTVVNNESSLNQNEGILGDSSHSHTFVINAGTGLMLYGACVVQTEMLRVYLLFLLLPSPKNVIFS